jgi:translation initiation factor 2B subunit (eIF-2B alpha/beta/delta family)
MTLWYAQRLSARDVSETPQILTHSYSRVVTQALLHAHTRKRISVYVTEARPRGLGCAGSTPIHPLTPRIYIL